MRIALQVPEGLKHKAHELVKKLEAEGHTVFLFIDPCFGACDVRAREAQAIGVDKIIHVGHAPFPGVEGEVEYDEWKGDVDINAIVSTLKGIDGKVALCATVQYAWVIEEVKKRLGDKVVVGKGKRAAYPGQVLGCDAGACRVDADVNVVIGDGLFHAVMAYVETGRKTYVVHPDGSARDVTGEAERFLKRRRGVKAAAFGAERWGVVISTKPGQMNVPAAEKIKKLLEEMGREAHILVCDYFFPEYVEGMKYDVYVFTGCPRVALDDWERFKKPVLTVEEALEVIEWISESMQTS